MAARLLRWFGSACLIGCGLLAASACLDPKSDDLPTRSEPDSFTPSENPDQEVPLGPGGPSLGGVEGQGDSPPPMATMVTDVPASGAGGSPATLPPDAGSADTFAADAGVELDPGVGEPNIAR